MSRKAIAVWLNLVILLSLFVVMDVTVDFTPNVGGATLYVNTTGSGGAYTKIQNAINAAGSGSTVFVYNGTYYEDVVANKKITLMGENRDGTIIDGQGGGNVVYVTAQWVTIQGFTLTNGSNGVYVYDVNYCSIVSNNISSNGNYGIYVTTLSGYNVITENKVSNNTYNIHLYSSVYNEVLKNQITRGWGGIYLDPASNNNIVSGNNVTKVGVALHLYRSSNNQITDNNFTSNSERGINFVDSSNNYLIRNNISYNGKTGIRIAKFQLSGSNNRIYHNNIIGNADQAYDETSNKWDNGYPSGGNYWSDYTGPDNNGDGIGDIPYVIDANSRDYYPLMGPFSNHTIENYTTLKKGWNLISIPLIQNEQNLSNVLESIDGWYDAVQWNDIADPNDPWKHHKVGKPFGNDLDKINETMGFWVHITRAGNSYFLYNGTQPTVNQTISLQPGWNLVGYPSQTKYNRTEGLNNLTFGTEIDSIWTYNATTQKWEEIGPSDFFEPCRGYWIYANTKCEWEVPL